MSSDYVRASLIGAGFAAWMSAAFAGTVSKDLSVTATVVNGCAIRSTATLAFGTYDPGGIDLTSSNGLISIACTQSASATVTLGQGVNPASGSTDVSPLRRMKSGNSVLAYALYQDDAHTTPWGNAQGTGIQRITSGGTDSLVVYGVLPGGQNVPAGLYTDTLVVTVTF